MHQGIVLISKLGLVLVQYQIDKINTMASMLLLDGESVMLKHILAQFLDI